MQSMAQHSLNTLSAHGACEHVWSHDLVGRRFISRMVCVNLQRSQGVTFGSVDNTSVCRHDRPGQCCCQLLGTGRQILPDGTARICQESPCRRAATVLRLQD